MAKPSKEVIFQDLLGILDQLSEDWEYSGDITLDTLLLADLDLESIDMVVLGEYIEEHYKQPLPFVEYLTELAQRERSDITISDIVDFINTHLKGQRPE